MTLWIMIIWVFQTFLHPSTFLEQWALLISSLLWLLMAFGYVLLLPTLKRSQSLTCVHHLTVAVVLSEAVP